MSNRGDIAMNNERAECPHCQIGMAMPRGSSSGIIACYICRSGFRFERETYYKTSPIRPELSGGWHYADDEMTVGQPMLMISRNNHMFPAIKLGRAPSSNQRVVDMSEIIGWCELPALTEEDQDAMEKEHDKRSKEPHGDKE